MFTSIRNYSVRRGSAEEIARRVRESFVPLIRQMRGFKGYYLLDGGPDVLICAITSTSHRLRLRHPQQDPAKAQAPARSYLVFFDWDKATLTHRARQIIGEAAANSTKVQYTRIRGERLYRHLRHTQV